MSARAGVSAANFAQHRHEKPGISEFFILTFKTWDLRQNEILNAVFRFEMRVGGGTGLRG